jgi:hypothetical protein
MDQTTSQQPTNNNLTDMLIRINTVEQQIKHVQIQLNQYVTIDVNNLQLQSIHLVVDRIEHDVGDLKHQFVELNAKLSIQDIDAKQRDAAQRESQDKLQIRVLYGIVSIAIAVLIGVLIAYFTHFIR